MTKAEDAVTEALRGFVRAWEALPGNRHYGAHEVQRWISGPMKTAVDDARAAIAKIDGSEQ
jgi:hypothetical protein